MKLWHTTFYDSEIKLKQLYTKICHRLPAYSCKLYVVKEIVNQGKIQVKEVHSQRNPFKKVSSFNAFPTLGNAEICVLLVCISKSNTKPLENLQHVFSQRTVRVTVMPPPMFVILLLPIYNYGATSNDGVSVLVQII